MANMPHRLIDVNHDDNIVRTFILFVQSARAVLKYTLDLPPEKESSFMLDWKIRKGATDGQKVLHTGADSQQAA